jgi:hypothetical protein
VPAEGFVPAEKTNGWEILQQIHTYKAGSARPGPYALIEKSTVTSPAGQTGCCFFQVPLFLSSIG